MTESPQDHPDMRQGMNPNSNPMLAQQLAPGLGYQVIPCPDCAVKGAEIERLRWRAQRAEAERDLLFGEASQVARRARLDALGGNLMTATARVLIEVHAERKRQELKWGEQNHAPPTYLTILGEEFGEACQAALNITSPGEKGMETAALAEAELREELVQVAAVAVAAIECLDRAKWKADDAYATTSLIACLRAENAALAAERDALLAGAEAEAWKEDARRYASNAAHYESKAAEARIEALEWVQKRIKAEIARLRSQDGEGAE